MMVAKFSFVSFLLSHVHAWFVETVNVTVSRNKFHRNIRMLPHEAPALLSSPAGKQV